MKIQWKDRYNIGFKEIDDQHRKLLDIVNDLSRMINSVSDSVEDLRSILLRLIAYAKQHFKYEERYMEKSGYHMMQEHIQEHRQFIQKIVEFNNLNSTGNRREMLENIFDFLKNWYLNHIIHSDKQYENAFKHYIKNIPVKGIIFDYGNVLETFENRIFFKKLSDYCPHDTDFIEQTLLKESDIIEAFETGQIEADSLYREAAQRIQLELPADQFFDLYCDIFEPVEGINDLIRNLKSHYKIGLISNTNPVHFDRVIQKNPVYPLFDAVTTSHEVGCYKPDRRIFEDSLQQLDLEAEACVFIDDIGDYVEQARILSFKGIVFQSLDQLRSELMPLQVKGL